MDVAQRVFGWEDLANLNSHLGGGKNMKGNEKKGSVVWFMAPEFHLIVGLESWGSPSAGRNVTAVQNYSSLVQQIKTKPL